MKRVLNSTAVRLGMWLGGAACAVVSWLVYLQMSGLGRTTQRSFEALLGFTAIIFGTLLLLTFWRAGGREAWRWLYRLPGVMLLAGLTLVSHVAGLDVLMFLFGGLMLLCQLAVMVGRAR